VVSRHSRKGTWQGIYESERELEVIDWKRFGKGRDRVSSSNVQLSGNA